MMEMSGPEQDVGGHEHVHENSTIGPQEMMTKPGPLPGAPSATIPKSGKSRKSGEDTPKSQAAAGATGTSARVRQKPSRADLERRNARKLLGELWS
ncbi:hypothetical protein KR084_003826 [Drosophila pseudotakahashii]|nr:hypothetical protein KR084_003826 [Drosophila pseudotakahashii]